MGTLYSSSRARTIPGTHQIGSPAEINAGLTFSQRRVIISSSPARIIKGGMVYRLGTLLIGPEKGRDRMKVGLARSVYIILAPLLVALGSTDARSQSTQGGQGTVGTTTG